MQLEARDKRALIGGSVAVVGLLAYLLWPSPEDPSAVELVSPAQRQGAAAPAAPMQVQPPNVIAAPPAVPAPVAAPAALPEGMTLAGVAGSGAIISFKDGSQRFVGRGRQVAPGVTLQAIALRHVILAAGPTSYRLGFGGGPIPLQPPAAPLPAAGMSPAAPNLQAETAQYLQGMTPHRVNGNVIGYQIGANASLPVLQRAGLRPGDVVVSVNGHSVDSSEKLTELAAEIRAASRTEFEFIRDGRKQRVSVDAR